MAKRAFRKASVGVLTRETSYPEARETSAELMVSSSVMIVSVHVARTLDGRPGGRAEHTVRPTPLEPPCHPAPRFRPFFGLVRGSRAAVAPQGGQGGLGGPQSSVSTRAQERIPTCLVVIRSAVGAWLWV